VGSAEATGAAAPG